MKTMQPGAGKGEAAAGPAPTPEELAGMLWMTAGPLLSRAAYNEMQAECLKTCKVFNAAGNVYEAVLMADGRFTRDALRDDPTVADRLISEVMQFSLACF